MPTRRDFLKKIGIGSLGAAGAASLPGLFSLAEDNAGRKLNFVFFLVDDLGWRDLAYMGSTYYQTPNLDAGAKEGMVFTHAYAACTVCSPTRASIMTGKYPGRLHITNWITGHPYPFAKLQAPEWRQHLPLEEVTIAETLKKAGYVTAHVGKWHLGEEEYYPDRQGFDFVICAHKSGGYHGPFKNIKGIKESGKDEYLTDRLTDEAAAWITENRDKPFYLYLSHFAVHTPIQSKKEYEEEFRARADRKNPQHCAPYAGMIKSVDDSFGKIQKTLKELQLEKNTVVIFMSDNGGLVHGSAAGAPITSNAPLRAGKGSPYEGGHRTPMFAIWPGVTKPGSICDTPVMSIDFYPTMLDMAGIETDKQNIDGASIVPLLKQKEFGERDLYWHYPHYHPGGATPYTAVRSGDYKLIEFYEDKKLELYNVVTDEGESKNLAAEKKDVAENLRAKIVKWRKDVGAQDPVPNPNHDPKRARQPDEKGEKKKKKKGSSPN